MSHFAFALCQPSFENVLKADLARRRPDLRLAFSRPGLVTFKSDVPVALGDPVPSPFARAWGRSLGRARDLDEAVALIGTALQEVRAVADRVHVVARDPLRGDAATVQQLVSHWSGLAQSLGAKAGGRSEPGEQVASAIVAPNEPTMIGLHRQVPGRYPLPGGAIAVEVPPDAPSRAYAKIEEAIAWGELDVRAGDVALELGSAPGGACYALVRRGVTVHGVDMAALDPAVLAYRHPSGARVHAIRATLGSLRIDQLPPHVDWLLCDVNLAPQVALHGIARLLPPLRKGLRGAVFTLKLNEWELAAGIDAFARRIAELGLGSLRVTHLPSNRREVCAIASRAPLDTRR